MPFIIGWGVHNFLFYIKKRKDNECTFEEWNGSRFLEQFLDKKYTSHLT